MERQALSCRDTTWLVSDARERRLTPERPSADQRGEQRLLDDVVGGRGVLQLHHGQLEQQRPVHRDFLFELVKRQGVVHGDDKILSSTA